MHNTDDMYLVRKDFFDRNANKWIDMWYKNPDSPQENKHLKDFERLFDMLPLKAGDRVLDAGCGAGVLVPFIMPRIGDSGVLYELDFSEKMIEVNRSEHAQPNIEFIVADVENAPVESASCDLAICFSCFPHFYDKLQALRSLFELTKPSGKVVVAHFASASEINDHHRKSQAVMHDHLPDEAEMRGLFVEAGLAVDFFIDEPGFYYVIAGKN